MIDLKNIFFKLSQESYSVIKISEIFPDYNPGNDIDIFCFNPTKIAEIILLEAQAYVKNGYSLQVEESNEKIYIDFLKGEEIDIRFDLYKKLPDYLNLNIKPALFESIIENSIPKKISSNFSVFVPGLVDDILIRYMEYHEWYSERPDKIKHIEYIYSYVDNNFELKRKFLDKLHHYTEISRRYEVEMKWDKNVKSKSTKKRISRYLKKMKSLGLIGLFVFLKKKIIKRLKK